MPVDSPPNDSQIFCNNPQHQTLAQEIYKRSAELVEEKKHTENLLYNISEAVVAVDKDYNINLINKVAEELLQISSQQVEGKYLGDFLKLKTEEDAEVAPQDYCFKNTDVLMQNLVHNSKTAIYQHKKPAGTRRVHHYTN